MSNKPSSREMKARYTIRRTLDLREYQVIDNWKRDDAGAMGRPVIRRQVDPTPGVKPPLAELQQICLELNSPA